MKVSDILKVKGTALMTVRPAETIRVVAKRLRQDGVGALIVSNNGVALDGIITERDLSIGVALHGGDVVAMPASDLMTTKVVTCTPEDSIAEVARVMTVRRLRHLPVKEGTRLVGIVSIANVLKYRLDETRLERQVLYYHDQSLTLRRWDRHENRRMH